MKQSVCIGISAPEVKLAKALHSNKKIPADVSDACKISSDRLFICEGLWVVKKIISNNIFAPYFFFCPEMIKTEEEKVLIDMMINYASQSFSISSKVCSKISDRDGADGFFIIADLPEYSLADIKLKDNMTAIILDGQEQPGNIGAIIRSLDGAGGDFAVMTNQRVKMTHSRLIRSSLGASFTMPVAEAPMDNLIAWLSDNNFKIILTDLSAKENYYNVDYSGRVAIVAGNEFNGISGKWRTLSNSIPIIIPMLGGCESLNVGFASTLVAYECS
ncbi:MAG: hypothetical protein IJZ90_03650, partial [Clostridia bacterium]|nr:hypothetical protein [Clostridia bacterium]